MRIGPICARAAGRATERMRHAILAIGLAALVVAGCAGADPAFRPAPAAMSAAPSAGAGAPVPAGNALPLEEAVLSLADAIFAGSPLPPPPPGGRYKLVIDPLIDRATGAETGATRSMVARIEALLRDRYPQFELRPFTTATLEEQPLILLGSITPAEAPGSLADASGPTETYRIWAVLGDMRNGRILAHPTAWVRATTVDATPTAFFRDSPGWVAEDEARAAYLRTCAGNPGDPIDPAYLRMLRAQALIADGVRDYEAGRFRQALARYDEAASLPGGEQPRLLNGIYLANWALGRRPQAEAAFGRLVDYGLRRDRLAVKFLFRPGSTAFWPDPEVSGPYPMWLRQIARRSDERGACLQVTGHTSLTGSADLNDRLSLARAQRVQAGLIAERPALRNRTWAEGVGSRQPIVGTGTDDARDALDRRVEFRPLACPATTAMRQDAQPGG